MVNGSIQSFRADRWLYLFIFAHLLFWTVVPVLIRYNLPLDSIEGTLWGHQLEWGYDKNPFLNAWLTALATYLDGQSGWMVYLFSQLSVVICFWAIWQLAKQMVAPVYALIAVMILEGVQYYHFHAIDFNDNTLELSLWALTIYCFYQALRLSDKLSWILTGLFAGLAMMAKYYTAALLAAMVLFLFLRAENRKQLATLSPYLGCLTLVAILLPHTIWLYFHDFITVNYVFERGSSTFHWTNRFIYPAQFAWQQLQTFLPALILYTCLFLGKKKEHAVTLVSFPESSLTSFNRSFLIYVGLGPFLLTILLSFLCGTKLRAGWGMPLLSTWGILLVMLLPPVLTTTKMVRFITSIFILMGLFLSAYSVSLIYSSSASSANFPGHEIAETLTKQWRDKYHTNLAYVAGSRWRGGNVGFYSPDHPAVFIEWESTRAPWINSAEMQRKGALFLWDISDNETLPDSVRAQFPRLEPSVILEFSWHRDKDKKLAPIKIGMAFLPPQERG